MIRRFIPLLLLCATAVHAAKDPGTARLKSLPFTEEELHCLSQNVYFEARDQPFDGQVAVAFVAMNRAFSPHFPQNLCSVIKQGGTRRHRCQFSWYCDGKSDRPREKDAWRQAQTVAYTVALGYSLLSDPTKGALFYHAEYVRPKWRFKLQKTASIHHHIFYRFKTKK